MIEPAAGSVIIASDFDELCACVKDALDYNSPEKHGKKYSQKFVAKKISERMSICFYCIKGYETESENRAFEHAFFHPELDDFITDLEDCDTLPDHYLILADVGSTIEEGDFAGFESVEEGLAFFGTTLDELRVLKEHAEENSTLIWDVDK